MRWILVLVIIILLLGGGFWYYAGKRANIAQQETICHKQSDYQKLISALRTGELDSCNTLNSVFKSRCIAYLSFDPSACEDGDIECTIIANNNASLCPDQLCIARITKNVALCNDYESELRKECIDLVNLNAEGFTADADYCSKFIEVRK